MDKVFLERYNRLNKAQKEAVDTIEGPVMVIAGPGTGKTTILTLRIANILKQTDTPASGILAITFTDAGVKAMKQKLREIIGSRADEVKIHTFHSFAGSVISEFKEYFVHVHNAKQMTDIDQAELVREILTDKRFKALRPLGNPDFYIDPILYMIRDAKRDAVTPAMLAEFAKEEIKKIESDESNISSRGATKGQLKAEAKRAIEKCERTQLAAQIYTLYEEEKRKQKKMDFDDLIAELLAAMRENETLLRSLQEKYLYIHVDEHQDTNDSQNLIVNLLAEFFDNPNVFIVGDEKQAIYRFQGASVENFLRFEKLWKGMKVISLEDNYRSHQHILDASFAMIERNYAENEYEKLRVKLNAGNNEHQKPVEIVTAGNVAAGEVFLIKELKRITEKEADATVAIISRTNKDIERIVRICDENGVPVSSERSIDIFSHSIGVTFFSLIEFITDPTRADALGRTLIAGLWGLDFDRSAELLKRIRKEGIELNGEGIEKHLSGLADIRKELATDSPLAFLSYASEWSGFMNVAVRDPAYIEVWRGILRLAESLTRQGNISDPIALIEKLLQYRDRAEEKMVKISMGTTDAQIKAMTAHGSKGLEFDCVFIPYGTEESWKPRSHATFFTLPISAKVSDADEIRDARRLFYVALTRAKKHVAIIVPEEESNGEMLSSLRFIQELDEASVARVSVPRAEHMIVEKNNQRISKNQKLLDYIRHTLSESGLSVTALNNFLECPSTFIYRSIFKIPEPPQVNIEKGNAMHKAFARIWADQNKSLKNIQHTIESTVREHVLDTLLKGHEKEALITELIEDAPAIAECLETHFKQEGTQFIESWSEFEFSSGAEKVRLHGKLDAVIDTGDHVLVFDYKTRGKMSENAIKGLTKADVHGAKGAYFRQMVFYKLLLENDSRFKGKDIIPSLVFVKPDEKGMCHTVTLSVTDEDVVKVKGEITSLLESVHSGKILEAWCDDAKCESCAFKRIS